MASPIKLLISSSSEDMFYGFPNARCLEVTNCNDELRIDDSELRRRFLPSPQASDQTLTLCKDFSSDDTSDCAKQYPRKSTACETELDFSQKHSKNSDFEETLLANKPARKPSLLANLCLKEVTKQRAFEDIILETPGREDFDSELFLGKRTLSSGHPTPMEDGMMQLIQSKGATLAASKMTSEGTLYTIICANNHRFSRTSAGEAWCTICSSVLQTIQRYAQEKNGLLLSTDLRSEVTFRCAEGHEWTAPSNRATKTWCKDCKKKKKTLLKEMIEEENVRVNEERRRKQNIMLEEARIRLQQGERIQQE